MNTTNEPMEVPEFVYRDIRLEAEAVGKAIQKNAVMLREAGDDVVNQLFTAMGVWSSPVN